MLDIAEDNPAISCSSARGRLARSPRQRTSGPRTRASSPCRRALTRSVRRDIGASYGTPSARRLTMAVTFRCTRMGAASSASRLKAGNGEDRRDGRVMPWQGHCQEGNRRSQASPQRRRSTTRPSEHRQVHQPPKGRARVAPSDPLECGWWPTMALGWDEAFALKPSIRWPAISRRRPPRRWPWGA